MATTSRTTGTTRLLTTVIQWGWSFRMRFSPGRSLLMAGYCRSLEGVQQHDQGPGGEVGPVRDRALEGSMPSDVSDRDEPGKYDAVEHRRERVGPAEEQAHEGGKLDVAETQRFGFED